MTIVFRKKEIVLTVVAKRSERMVIVVARSKNNGEAFQKRIKDISTKGIDIKGEHRDFKSTQDFADFLDVSRQTLSHWLYGNRTPDMDMLIKISKALNMSIDYLVGLTDSNTYDADIQAVTRYTGLSEKTIDSLVNRYEGYGALFIEGFVSGNLFDPFMVDICKAVGDITSLKGMKNLPAFGEHEIEGEKYGSTKKDMLRLYAYEAGQYVATHLNYVFMGSLEDAENIYDAFLEKALKDRIDSEVK